MENLPPYKVTLAETLVPYARNSRTHSPEQVNQIAASIREFGFTNPILIDGDGGIIAGHGRLLAAQKLDIREVPTIELSGLTDDQKRAYIIADNKLVLNAGWDDEMLRVEFDALADSQKAAVQYRPTRSIQQVKNMSRKPHEPTEKTRTEVKALAGFGVISDEIATYIGIAPKTLRKHYRDELDTGHIHANAAIARSLFHQATNGSTSAAIFWLKSRANWRENIDVNHKSDDGSMTPPKTIVIRGPVPGD